MVRRAALVLACVLGTAGCLRARGTPEEPVVVSFRLEGVHAFQEDDVKAKLATQPSGRFAWNEPMRLDPDALAVDRRRVEAYYRERGYYQARVEDVRVEPAGRGRVKVTMRIAEGQPVRVASVAVNGLESVPEVRGRLAKLPLRPGDVFSNARYDGTRNTILGTLRSSGWATAEVTHRAFVQPEAGTAEVVYDVQPGERWKFGPIRISGTQSVPHERIREQVLGALTPGDWFDDTRLAVAQARVFSLGVFGGVRVVRGTPDPKDGTIAVVVNVREAPFRTLRVGPGIGVQVIRWDAHGLFSWEHRNFYGELRRVDTDLRLGYAWLPNPYSATKEGPVGLVGLGYSQPGALTRWVDTSARVEVEKGIEQAYDFYAERLRLALPLRLASRWSVVPSYNLEVYQVSNFGGVALNQQLPTGGRILENCVGSVCLLTYVEQRVAWDGRDDPVNTRRGLYVSFSVQEGFNVGAYGYRYLRFLPELRTFWPLGTQTVLAVRGRIGALVPVREEGDPPIVARFTAGGPLSMRGYYARRLAKMLRDPSRHEWVPVGGNGLLDGSVELRFDLTSKVGTALFVDVGNVSDASAVPSTWEAALDPTGLQWAAGVGLRYRSPVGPLRLDIAVRLPENLSARPPPVPFTSWPDGTPHREQIVAVHFSLGEAF